MNDDFDYRIFVNHGVTDIRSNQKMLAFLRISVSPWFSEQDFSKALAE